MYFKSLLPADVEMLPQIVLPDTGLGQPYLEFLSVLSPKL